RRRAGLRGQSPGGRQGGERVVLARDASAGGHLREGGARGAGTRPGAERAGRRGRAGCAMSFSWPRVLTIARREFLSTVRRKAFVFTLIGMPAYFAFVSWMAIKPQIAERLQALKSLTVLAVVDSSGLYHGARREIRTEYSPGATPLSTATGPAAAQG